MEYSNSSLVDKVIKSPNFTRGRVNISKITVHHMAGNLSIEACGKSFNNPSRSASANYLIGTDGRIALCVDEANRAWTSSSKWNDERAVTIEVANDGDENTGWHVSDKAFNALVNLCKDICKRNNITKLEYTGKKEGSLTIHSIFKATACPGPYLKSRLNDLCNLVNESEEINMDNSSNEIKVKEYLEAQGLTKNAVAGIMANIRCESNYKPNNLQTSGNKKLNITDEEYTRKVDNNEISEDSWEHDGFGYGLCQWTFYARKKVLRDYARLSSKSIGDLTMQLDFMMKEISAYKSLYNMLFDERYDCETIAMAMCETYEKPANAEERSKERAEEAREIYDKYYTENSLYRVQVGAFRNRANAENMLNKLKSAGFVDAFITEVEQ